MCPLKKGGTTRRPFPPHSHSRRAQKTFLSQLPSSFPPILARPAACAASQIFHIPPPLPPFHRRERHFNHSLSLSPFACYYTIFHHKEQQKRGGSLGGGREETGAYKRGKKTASASRRVGRRLSIEGAQFYFFSPMSWERRREGSEKEEEAI